jgi:uncharacterized protein (DUF1697 family)
MQHYVAFLRGINLGKRRLKMDRLRALFAQLNFTDVATFIASGNVIFASKTLDERSLVDQIQTHLHRELGYEVHTFIRTRSELAAAAAFQPFSKGDLAHPAHTVYAGFLAQALTAVEVRRLIACRTEVDDFCVNGREFYWLCRIKSNDSKVWNSSGMKALALPSATMRNIRTVRQLAEQYPVVA